MKPPEAAPASPPVDLFPVRVAQRTLHVVRDDRLALGTKGRAFPSFPPDTRDVLYTGSAFGYGPVVAAAAARAAGLRCTLLLHPHPPGSRGRLAVDPSQLPPVVAARSLGADIRFVDEWRELVRQGQEMQMYWCPLGFLDNEYIDALACALRAACAPLAAVPEGACIWVIGGSGTVAIALSRALPARRIRVVPINAKTRCKLEDAAKKYGHAMDNLSIEDPPTGARAAGYPVPFVPGYDSLLWDAVAGEGRAADGDVVWNVARGGDWLV